MAGAQETTFRSRTELVTVPVVVTRDGKHVPGLKQEAFQLVHEGKRAKIAVFEEVRDRRRAAGTEQLPAPGTVQNFIPPESQDVVIIVIHASDWYSENNVRAYLSDIAKSLAADRTPVSVLLFVRSTLVQVHSFSASPAEITKSVDVYLERNRSWRTLENAMSRGSETDTTNADFPGAFLEQARLVDDRTRLDAISQLAMAYRGVPGRKKLIWMANTFFGGAAGVDYLDLLVPGKVEAARPGVASTVARTAEMRDAALRALSDANIAVYPVDLHGVPNPVYAAINSGRLLRGEMAHTLSMLEVAGKTGGKNCTDLPLRCVRAIQEDGNDYYVLGFYLEKDAQPGWHQLKVEVRDEGLAVRARSGFAVAARDPTLAATRTEPGKTPASANAVTEPLRDEVRIALGAPVDHASVPLRLRWKVIPGEGANRKLELFLSSPAGGISVDAADPRLDVDMLAFVRPVGKLEGTSFPQSLTRRLSSQELERLSRGGFAYRKIVDLAPGRYGLRVLVRDNNNGKIGTVSTMVDVP